MTCIRMAGPAIKPGRLVPLLSYPDLLAWTITRIASWLYRFSRRESGGLPTSHHVAGATLTNPEREGF